MLIYFVFQSTLNMNAPLVIPFRIWVMTAFFVGCCMTTLMSTSLDPVIILECLLITLIAAICSLPVFIALIISLKVLARRPRTIQQKAKIFFACLIICDIIYSVPLGLIYEFASASWFRSIGYPETLLTAWLAAIASLVLSTSAAYMISRKKIWAYHKANAIDFTKNQEPHMDNSKSAPQYSEPEQTSHNNRTLIKGLITGGLILVMLIPTIFISNLVQERQARQKEVTAEVSSKWASAQTLAGPYIYLPYRSFHTNAEGKTVETTDQLWILPDNLQVDASIDHEIRTRSIYKVLVYRTALSNIGSFQIEIPKEIDASLVKWPDAKICYRISDFKGLEEKLQINFNGSDYELTPGLPGADETKGLCAPINLTATDLAKKLSFRLNVKIKGSEDLHFIPLAGNSSFSVQSKWKSPSFDGNVLPTERTVNDSGFHATWIFNKANLPFTTVINDLKADLSSLAFGVTLIQPADGYAKTNRCIKYAILFIGLSFSLFFIVEIMQKKPLHPVQYVLIGLALVIFFTLLLAFSEFIDFDFAYGIASLATILLVSLYAKSHFQSWKSAGVFGAVLSVLYGFIFVLIQLEDTALLIGSVGLFVILALVMFASRKVAWYSGKTNPVSLQI